MDLIAPISVRAASTAVPAPCTWRRRSSSLRLNATTASGSAPCRPLVDDGHDLEGLVLVEVNQLAVNPLCNGDGIAAWRRQRAGEIDVIRFITAGVQGLDSG